MTSKNAVNSLGDSVKQVCHVGTVAMWTAECWASQRPTNLPDVCVEATAS